MAWVPKKIEKPQWRINGGRWNREPSARKMLVEVAAALLDLDTNNAKRLFGQSALNHIHREGTLKDRLSPSVQTAICTIPRHPDYEVCSNMARNDIVAACLNWGDKCGVMVEAREPTNCLVLLHLYFRLQ